MSAADYYQPHVFIDGVQLSEHRGIDGLTPIADISIKWGANDWWRPVEPSRLNLTILDPRGELLALSRGVEVRITADPDGRTMFEGVLEASTARFKYRQNQRGKRVPVWEVMVEAFDPLAQLAADRKHGPTYSTRNAQQNNLHWGRQLIAERFQTINQRSPKVIEWDYSDYWRTTDQYLIDSPNAYVYPCAPYTTQQNVSVLEVLRKSARILHPLNRPYFDHRAGKIRLARPQFVGWPLFAAEAWLNPSLEPLDIKRTGGRVQVIDSSALALGDSELELDLKPQDNLTQAQLIQRREELVTPQAGSGYWGTHYDVVEAFGSTTTIGGPAGEASVELETDLSAGWNWYPDASQDLANLMRATHEWRSPPKIRYRVGKTATGNATLHESLFAAHPVIAAAKPEQLLAFALVNTPLQWSGTLPYFSLVGGELRYNKTGWSVTATPAVVPTLPDTGTTLGGPFSDSNVGNVEIMYANSALTVGDFQII